jgi:hypothetical protein
MGTGQALLLGTTVMARGWSRLAIGTVRLSQASINDKLLGLLYSYTSM